jgi:putative methionine-R-sulfoxide reductase with GAF domain
MTASLPNTPASLVAQSQARNVYRLAIVLIIAATLILPLYLVVAWQVHSWLLVVAAAAFVLLDVLAYNSLRFSRRGRQDIGAGHLTGGLLFVALVNAAIVSGTGLMFGLGSLLMTAVLATQIVVTQRWINRALVLAVIVGILSGLLEIFPPPFQVPVHSFQAAIPVLSVSLMMVFAGFVAVNFRSYSLSNKLIIAFLVVTLVSVGIVVSAINIVMRLRFSSLAAQNPAIAQAMTATFQVSLLATIAAIALACLGAILIAGVLARPIAHLTEVAREVKTGNLSVEAKVETNDETGVLAATFNSMTSQLRQTLQDLELRVSERTRALETSAQISRRLSTLLDEKLIVAEVVEQLRAAYDYYHVHIYLWDAARENLAMAGGTGEAGRTLLARGHHLQAGRGLVGRAADTNTVVLATDVLQMAGWVPNPLLPDTKSEVAVPIALGEQVLGVLDVQQDSVGALKAADADLIQTVAQQTAIALQNARSYAQAQREAQTEVLLRDITQKIQSATTAPAAMQTAIRELGKALGAERVSVRLTAEATGEAEPAERVTRP